MRKVLFPVVVLLLVTLALWGVRSQVSAVDYALAEMKVRNLTCGACVGNIEKALAASPGVGAIDVNLTSGRVRVEFDPDRTRSEDLSRRISEAGYPAAVNRTFSPAEYRNFLANEDRMSTAYVARIGERLIDREAFAAVLGELEEGGPIPGQGLLKAAWSEILRRELPLADAEANGVIVTDQEVKQEMERIRLEFPEESFSDEESFAGNVRENLILRNHLEQNILKNSDDPGQRRHRLSQWFQGLPAAHPVTIYDPALRKAVAGGKGGCGGSCCG